MQQEGGGPRGWRFDSVVVGGGVMGYSAALALARQGHHTVLLEQFPSPHTRGSSAGQSRITRVANFGAAAATPVMVAALRAWRELEAESGTQLFVPVPLLCVGGNKAYQAMKRSMYNAGSSPQMWSIDSVNKEFGANFPATDEAFMDLDAGILLATQCLLVLKKLFTAAGGVVMDRCAVAKVQWRSDSEVVVHGSRGDITARRAVVCAGCWTPKVLAGLVDDLPLKIISVGVYYWRQKDPSVATTSFVDFSYEDGRVFYGLPAIEYPGLVKIYAQSRVLCDPDRRDEADMSAVLRDSVAYVRDRFPSLHPRPAITEACMYTNTPDKDMILDYAAGHRNIAYACGFSGQGFKMGPTVGRLLCQMVTGHKLDHDIEAFSSSRF